MLINQEELTKDDMDQFSDFQGQRKPQKNHWFLVKIWQEAALTATLKIETWAFGLKCRNSNHEEDFWVRKKNHVKFFPPWFSRSKNHWFRRELLLKSSVVKKPADSKSRAFLPLVVNFASFLEGLTRSNPFFVEKNLVGKWPWQKKTSFPTTQL